MKQDKLSGTRRVESYSCERPIWVCRKKYNDAYKYLRLHTILCVRKTKLGHVLRHREAGPGIEVCPKRMWTWGFANDEMTFALPPDGEEGGRALKSVQTRVYLSFKSLFLNSKLFERLRWATNFQGDIKGY